MCVWWETRGPLHGEHQHADWYFLHWLRKWRPCYDRDNAVTLLSHCPKTVVSSLSALFWTGLTAGRIFPLVNARSLIDPISHQLCNHFRWKCKKCCMAAILPSHTLRSWWEQLWCSGTEGALPFKKKQLRAICKAGQDVPHRYAFV